MGQVHAAHPFWWKSETNPNFREDPQFPPHYGFEEGQRKPRVMIATPEEIIAAKVEPRYRDFCAHKYIQFKNCVRGVYPFNYRCKDERHEWELCELEDHIISRKEYERERRLLVRKQRKDRIERLKAERAEEVARHAEHCETEEH